MRRGQQLYFSRTLMGSNYDVGQSGLTASSALDDCNPGRRPNPANDPPSTSPLVFDTWNLVERRRSVDAVPTVAQHELPNQPRFRSRLW